MPQGFINIPDWFSSENEGAGIAVGDPLVDGLAAAGAAVDPGPIGLHHGLGLRWQIGDRGEIFFALGRDDIEIDGIDEHPGRLRGNALARRGQQHGARSQQRDHCSRHPD